MKNTYDEYDRTPTGVVINLGHVGADSSASENGIVEKNITLDIRTICTIDSKNWEYQ